MTTYPFFESRQAKAGLKPASAFLLPTQRCSSRAAQARADGSKLDTAQDYVATIAG